MMHLVKYLTLATDISRHQANFFIKKKRVLVDGELACDPKFVVANDSCVTFDGKPLSIAKHRYFLLHKPVGYACSAQDKNYASAATLIPGAFETSHAYFAGALEANVAGLVLLSDDLKWVNRAKLKIRKSKKAYEFLLDRSLNSEDLSYVIEQCEAHEAVFSFSTVTEKASAYRLSLGDAGLLFIYEILKARAYLVERATRYQIGRLTLDLSDAGRYTEMDVNQIKI